jgi:hypothetical protein
VNRTEFRGHILWDFVASHGYFPAETTSWFPVWVTSQNKENVFWCWIEVSTGVGQRAGMKLRYCT